MTTVNRFKRMCRLLWLRLSTKGVSTRASSHLATSLLFKRAWSHQLIRWHLRWAKKRRSLFPCCTNSLSSMSRYQRPLMASKSTRISRLNYSGNNSNSSSLLFCKTRSRTDTAPKPPLGRCSVANRTRPRTRCRTYPTRTGTMVMVPLMMIRLTRLTERVSLGALQPSRSWNSW